eukprot:CAMPEP_0202909850 /NCGR_PEP_ID=MMETSP1392-20130828/50449_1 /ASSEMBLY_ACC=CAM_ASM_000868 /TAXON_ID=225041 /ORGANISM="Chlamydomonas chlamydogama, Strain SAG 11-48b" /LENGTH=53 /DNA_ID=CAMNT_0049599731 /DNA_START=150 /DNA_END=308 /DNA_ORIENTATION=-
MTMESPSRGCASPNPLCKPFFARPSYSARVGGRGLLSSLKELHLRCKSDEALG